MEYPKITLKAARINQHLSQAEAAAAIGVTKDTISNYERGKTVPNWEIVHRMEEVYKVPVDYLLFARHSG